MVVYNYLVNETVGVLCECVCVCVFNAIVYLISWLFRTT